MKLELTERQFRRLLDLLYVGNWVINSTRGDDRITEFDDVESLVFGQCASVGMDTLAETHSKQTVPSRQFAEGGIHEVILDYENVVFFEILAEELARRDMQDAALDESDEEELNRRIMAYIHEFERNGTDNITLNL